MDGATYVRFVANGFLLPPQGYAVEEIRFLLRAGEKTHSAKGFLRLYGS